MSSYWIFQANPTHYDIDSALGVLGHIWWRTPQHASDIGVGDVVVVWRSGDEAGVVAVGRVEVPPQLHPMEAEEERFVLHDDEAPGSSTRTRISLVSTPLLSKERVRSIPELSEHRIVKAPMGTVFPLSEQEWSALSAHLPAPPELESPVARTALPPVFAWQQRAKGFGPMPGGYDGYLLSARRIADIVTERRPTYKELTERISEEFAVSPTGARYRAAFLRKAGFLKVDAGICHLGEWTKRWIESGDNDILIALLHSRYQFVGELLQEAIEPRTVDEMLMVVNDQYGIKWDTNTQLNNRRGWLQSAGHLIQDDDGRLVTTSEGRDLLSRLDLYTPSPVALTAPTTTSVADTDQPPVIDAAVETVEPQVETLATEIEDASTDSGDPDRFERAVRDAFAFLGFDAVWLGGSGRTDVLVDAPLGRDESYRVAVDAKTTAKGALSDQQVDWTTLVEHRRQHEADHSLLVAPNPTVGRLTDRATSHGVAVLSARQLAGLCRQHARSPLGLQDYRKLFVTGGPVDTTDLDESAYDAQRLVTLASAICRTLNTDATTFGPLTARDLWLSLARTEAGENSSESEIQDVLNTLASPLVGSVLGNHGTGYVLATNPRVTQLRLRLLGEAIAGSSPGDD